LNYLLPELNKRKICFVEISQAPDLYVENLYDVKGEDQIPDVFGFSKPLLKDVILAGNNGLTEESAKKLLQEGKIDMASFAKYYMSNPDVVARMKNKQPLKDPEFQFAYTGGERGYCDYPKYQ
jgi:N-ethylmaleimide reductase